MNQTSHHVLRLHIIGSFRFNNIDWEKSRRSVIISNRWKERLTFASFEVAAIVNVGFFLLFFLFVMDFLKLSDSVV